MAAKAGLVWSNAMIKAETSFKESGIGRLCASRSPGVANFVKRSFFINLLEIDPTAPDIRRGSIHVGSWKQSHLSESRAMRYQLYHGENG
jgi:hypothetical protein